MAWQTLHVWGYAGDAAADVTLRCDDSTFALLMDKRLTLEPAMAQERLVVEGDRKLTMALDQSAEADVDISGAWGGWNTLFLPRKLSEHDGLPKFDPSACPRIDDRQPPRGLISPKMPIFALLGQPPRTSACRFLKK